TLAKAMGSCFGVDDAVDMALEHEHAGDLTILGQLVHNPQTVQKLKEKGIQLVSSIDAMDEIKTKHVMITAHGASDQIKEKVLDKGFVLDDATCPLVQHVHRTIKRYVKKGFFPVVIGEEKHVEVRGIVGDLEEYLVVSDESDIDKLPPEKRKRLGIVSQTTQNHARVGEVAKAIQEREDVEETQFMNTVCKPTRLRQEAVQELTDEVDIMIVVGGKNSSNTRKLKLLGDSKGISSYHIESPDELDIEWFKGKEHVGITAGTSTPFFVIDSVHEAIQKISSEFS
ncbi:MAG: 4-hydroxy-3-methylbut-2-enyl diphosphate reductase, partial [Akkermansiaceae bacterium]